MSKLMKISGFTDDQTDKVIALWKKCGLTRSWNNPEKDIARKNSDKNGKFLIGQIDEVLMAQSWLAMMGTGAALIILL